METKNDRQDKRRRRDLLLAPDGSGLQATYYTGLLFGPSGCGKTTVAEQIVRGYTLLDGKAWAVDPNGAWDGTPGVKSLWPAEGTSGVDAMLADSVKWGPGLIIFDDADGYLRHSTEIQSTYLTSNRHFKKDQLVISRRPQGIPKDAIASARFVALFAGALIEVHAQRYLRGVFGDDVLAHVPQAEWHYLLITRNGGRWAFETRKTTPRKLRTKSDKT